MEEEKTGQHTPDESPPKSPDYSPPKTPDGDPPKTPDGDPPKTPDGDPPKTPDGDPPKTPDGDPPKTPDDTIFKGLPAGTKKTSKFTVNNEDKRKKFDIFIKCVNTEKVALSVSNIGGNITNVIKMMLSKKMEGKCGENGYVKEGSVEIINYSNGVCKAANIIFDVIYQCHVCNPVQGTTIECVVKNITKAGIRAEIEGYNNSPLVIFVARDHHYSVKEFSSINEGDKIHIKVVGQRFELNDSYVSVIAELDVKELRKNGTNRQRISIAK